MILELEDKLQLKLGSKLINGKYQLNFGSNIHIVIGI